MRYLIDTNVLINIIEGELSDKVRRIIEDYENVIYISSESVREFVILAKKKNKIKSTRKNLELNIFSIIENELGFKIKYISKEHLKTFAALDTVPDHNDAFDHLIISHAITEKLTLISNDTYFPKYKKYGLDLIYNR
jgi:PIN domain nuclease of toxin-antitoxin system